MRCGIRPADRQVTAAADSECTVLDLASVRSAGEVAELVTAAVQKGLTSPDRLRQLLDARARQRHRALILGMLAEVAAGVESYLEMLYLRTVERPHGHPVGYRQDPSPDLPYARDVKYDRYGLIVELNGRLGHEAEGRFRDMNPDNRHALRDELTLPSATSMSVADLVRWRSRSIWP